MGLRSEEIELAVGAQQAAAHDDSDHVRVVAGPGTGKSATIEERVCWLLENGVSPDDIVAVSFTRLAARDLGARIEQARVKRGCAEGTIAVSTLHSLALRALRRANVLAMYPADPVVLQQWETRNVFEAEFGEATGIGSIRRREQIRRHWEAYWSTGEFEPPNIVPPDPPILNDERESFNRFHRPRTHLYSCVLPGELVERCVEYMDAGTLDPAELLGIKHLIIDEFQDLNPMDLRFVHGLADRGVQLFVAGDDDQSLYSFRFATPKGVEDFPDVRGGCGDHTLQHCFRCTPLVLDAAQTLIRSYGADGRIEKNLVSLWDTADPRVAGGLGCWQFVSGAAEASAIAVSCRRLIDAGMNPHDLMILLVSTRTQAAEIQAALEAAEVPYEPVRDTTVADTEAGRAGYAGLSIVVQPDNHLAHRVLLGLRRGVGVRSLNTLAQSVIDNDRNYRALFYEQTPAGVIPTRLEKPVAATAAICAELASWDREDPIAARLDELCQIVDDVRDEEGASDELRDALAALPEAITLDEVHQYLAADKDEDRRRILNAYYARTGEPEPDTSMVPDRVQVLTMHGSKGLSAQVVFIPGLEAAILPGEKRRMFTGMVQEAARMLYVSITRARVVCVVSYAMTRFAAGQNTRSTPSEFTTHLGKRFERKADGISPEVARQTVEMMGSMR
jgi:DNA helicase-2/ATP-dependent DNA helicase PcrA